MFRSLAIAISLSALLSPIDYAQATTYIKAGQLVDTVDGRLRTDQAPVSLPLENVRLLENVSFVMKGGKVYKQL